MARSIPLASVAGPVDLPLTLESGQTYLWQRSNGGTYQTERPPPAGTWYWTTHHGEVVRVRQLSDRLEWEGTADLEGVVRTRLGLGDDLDAIRRSTSSDAILGDAFEAHLGLRIVREPFFPCLVSFICSTQMRVSRIFGMQRSLREAYGSVVEFDGDTYRTYPDPDRLADATESELRDLGLGYRAPYVRETAEMVASGALTEADLDGMAYEEARDTLTEFVGVGPKVADCVLLFSLGFLQAVPLDTWIRTAIEEYYPDCAGGSYAETSKAIREEFGGEFAGYAQTYVFHHLRTRESTP